MKKINFKLSSPIWEILFALVLPIYILIVTVPDIGSMPEAKVFTSWDCFIVNLTLWILVTFYWVLGVAYSKDKRKQEEREKDQEL